MIDARTVWTWATLGAPRDTERNGSVARIPRVFVDNLLDGVGRLTGIYRGRLCLQNGLVVAWFNGLSQVMKEDMYSVVVGPLVGHLIATPKTVQGRMLELFEFHTSQTWSQVSPQRSRWFQRMGHQRVRLVLSRLRSDDLHLIKDT